ncbi:MAG: pyridoxal phosphate-dependent aminotransferase [Planctomycetota bacterium]|jgi:aspartate aminotransferase|nr:pyridoxal phosphate-dependent aminotransferase [Planctomycetota bacterium]
MTTTNIQQAGFFSEQMSQIEDSATLSVMGKVKGLISQGVDIINLTAGEPDFSPPQCVNDAAIAAIKDGSGRYTPSAGLPELKAVAARAIHDEIGIDYQAQNIVVCNGGKIAIAQALMSILNPGDEVLIPVPCWTSYPEMVKLAGGVAVTVQCDDGMLPDIDALEAACTKKTKAILINTPSNPTGVVFPKQLCQRIGEWCLSKGIRVISDEMYCSLTYGGAKHYSPLQLVPELQKTSVWIGGMSKSFAMTGWRMGFFAGPSEWAAMVGRIQSQLTGPPNAISQYASIAALKQGMDTREQMRLQFEKRSQLVAARIKEIKGISCPHPQGAFYCFVDVSQLIGCKHSDGAEIKSGDDFAGLLLEADNVATIGGSAFMAPNHFRISFAASEADLERALDRLSSRVNTLLTSGKN